MDAAAILVVALAVAGYGLVSRRTEHWPLSAPLLFAALGVLAGPHGLGVLGAEVGHGALHFLAEITLIVILYADAARIDLRTLRRGHDLPGRTLLLGVPLIIGAGTVAGLALLPGFGWAEAALLAALLAPTDAALALTVTEDPRVPVRIRQALNVESGLNDGMVLPPILLFMCFVATPEAERTAVFWALFTLKQLILGPAVGVAVGWIGGRLVARASTRDWMTPALRDLTVLALGFAAFGAAEVIGGNGFIAAFTAGLTCGTAARGVCPFLWEFAESEGQLLALMTFLLFGAAIVPEALADADAATWLYAAASLTVVRMLPVGLSLVGKRLRPASVAFLGWFGPRGLASLVFGLLLVESAHLEITERIFGIVAATMTLSIVLHGVSASPLAGAYAAFLRRDGLTPACPESREVPHLPMRRKAANPA